MHYPYVLLKIWQEKAIFRAGYALENVSLLLHYSAILAQKLAWVLLNKLVVLLWYVHLAIIWLLHESYYLRVLLLLLRAVDWNELVLLYDLRTLILLETDRNSLSLRPHKHHFWLLEWLEWTLLESLSLDGW